MPPSPSETASRGASSTSIPSVTIESDKKLQQELKAKTEEIAEFQRSVKDLDEKVFYIFLLVVFFLLY